MRALVTGASGFAGQWLLRELLGAGWAVAAVSAHDIRNLILTDAEYHAVEWTRADLRDPDVLPAQLDRCRPDAVFHLAGISYVPAAAQDPLLALDINTGLTVRLLHAVQHRRSAGRIDPVVLLIGSGEQYGRHAAAEMPLNESAPLLPSTVYAATKTAQEIYGMQVFRASGMRVIMTRSFNHSGPGQVGEFVLPATVRRVRELRNSGGDELRVGNLEAVRDFLHVADAVAAYLALVCRGQPGEVYNVCSGRGWSVRELTDLALERAGVEARLVPDPSLLRPIDVPALVGDPRKIAATTGWAPRRTLTDIIDDLLHAPTL